MDRCSFGEYNTIFMRTRNWLSRLQFIKNAHERNAALSGYTVNACVCCAQCLVHIMIINFWTISISYTIRCTLIHHHRQHVRCVCSATWNKCRVNSMPTVIRNYFQPTELWMFTSDFPFAFPNRSYRVARMRVGRFSVITIQDKRWWWLARGSFMAWSVCFRELHAFAMVYMRSAADHSLQQMASQFDYDASITGGNWVSTRVNLFRFHSLIKYK